MFFNNKIWIQLIVVLIGCKSNLYSQQHLSNKLIACGDDKIVILNSIDEKGFEIIWSWSANNHKNDFPKGFYKLLQSLDDCKPIHNNKKLLVTSSGGGSFIINLSDKNIDFYAKTPMAHSADTLPGGFIIVANSWRVEGGNSLVLFNVNQSDRPIAKDSFYFAHGVVWNEKYQRLYALGFDELRSYKIIKDQNERSLILDCSWRLPNNGKGGHELSLVDQERILVTDKNNCYIFNLNNESFQPFRLLEGIKKVKSANYNPINDQLVFTVGEINWWTHNIYMKNPERVISGLPIDKMYKVRLVK